MRENGVALFKQLLRDRYGVKKSGELVILDTTDQGLHRQEKVARLIRPGVGAATMELVDPHVLWMSGERFVLTGFERCKNSTGQPVDYAQSWFCLIGQEAVDS
jgi:hypothetical protein